MNASNPTKAIKRAKTFACNVEAINTIQLYINEGKIPKTKINAAHWLIAVCDGYVRGVNRCINSLTNYAYAARDGYTVSDPDWEAQRKWSRRTMNMFAKAKAITVLPYKTELGCNIIKINRVYIERWLEDMAEKMSGKKCPTYRNNLTVIRKAKAKKVVPAKTLVQWARECMDDFVKNRIQLGINAGMQKILTGMNKPKGFRSAKPRDIKRLQNQQQIRRLEEQIEAIQDAHAVQVKGRWMTPGERYDSNLMSVDEYHDWGVYSGAKALWHQLDELRGTV